jgi:hypothetical protein
VDEVDATSLAGGLALVAVGAILLVDATGLADVGLGWLAPLLTGAAGVVLIASGSAARARSAPAAAASAPRPRSGGDALSRAWARLTSDETWSARHRPASVEDLRDRYRVGLGTLEVDLREIAPPPGRTEVHARVGIGTLTVTLPAEGRVVVRAHAGAGSVELLGETRGGLAATLARELGEAGENGEDGAELVVHASVDLGTVVVRRPG